MKIFDIAALLLLPLCVFAQEPQNEAEARKKMYENIEKQVETYEQSLKLEDWQVFYVDSILVHNAEGKVEELKVLQKSGVTNVDAFYFISDKWDERTYEAFRKVLNDSQWNTYLKGGAIKAKKERDKRAEKREK